LGSCVGSADVRDRSPVSQAPDIQVRTPKRGSTQRISANHPASAPIAHTNSIYFPLPHSVRAAAATLSGDGTVRSSSTGENGTGTSIAPMRLTGASR